MKFERSSCPITNVLDLLGDKWTLLVIRDLVLGKRRYQEFLASPELIASNILTERLNRLLDAGLISRQTYQQNPLRYQYLLTKKGRGSNRSWKRSLSGARNGFRAQRNSRESSPHERWSSTHRAGDD